MTDRRKTSDVLWYALQCAKTDRQSFIDAYDNDQSEPAVRNAQKDIAAFERLQLRLFGTTKSKLDVLIEKAVSVDVLRKRMLEDDQ